MAEITAAMVKELRVKTDAGMMDCKNALVEADGDMEKAVEVLRKSGIAKAAKKSGRSVKEGMIYALKSDNQGVLLEVLCETDFVAKNPNFGKYVQEAAERIIKLTGDGDISESAQESEKENLVAMIATIGENMQLRRVDRWETTGKLASYLHMGGRIGVMIDVEGEDDEVFLNDICMHIAAFKPQYLSSDDIPEDVIASEKDIATAQMAGKPAEIIGKIVNGKINKWFSEACLVAQPWIRDDKTSLAKLKPNLKIKRFIRWEIGEELS